MEVKISLNSSEYKDLTSYCNLNDLLISDVVKKSFYKGFNIERYGLLGIQPEEKTKEVIVEKIIEVVKEIPIEVVKEVIVEKIVEVIKEVVVEKLVEVPIEKTIEVIKEVVVEKLVEVPIEKTIEVIKEIPVEKIVKIYDNSEIEVLSNKIKELEEKESEIIEIIKEVPIETIKEVTVEVIKEVFVEKPMVEDTKQKMLEQTLQNLRIDMMTKDKKIKELEDTVSLLQRQQQNIGAAYLRGSNLDNTMFK